MSFDFEVPLLDVPPSSIPGAVPNNGEIGPEVLVIANFLPSTGGSGGGGGGGGGTGSGGASDHPILTGDGGSVETATCANSNIISGVGPVDGATYFVPESVTPQQLQASVNHVQAARGSGPEGKWSTIGTLYSMYENPSDPFFVDFKDWGSSNGPAGSESGGWVNYNSAATGTIVTGANAFEAFGNFWFGLLCTYAGFSPEETYAIAALTQSGRLGQILNGDVTQKAAALFAAATSGDDPQDRPHVDAGIASAQSYVANPRSMIGITLTACGS